MRRHLFWIGWPVAACAGAGATLGWSLAFETPSLQRRAALVQASVRQGGCDGAWLFETRLGAGTAAAPPPELPPGIYGFAARAMDAQCVWFAEGCVEVETPGGGSDVRVTLSPVEERGGCASGERCDTGRCVPEEDTVSVEAGAAAAEPSAPPAEVPATGGGAAQGDAGPEAGLAADAAPRQPRATCDQRYGGVGKYLLCEETPEDCLFLARTDGGSCDDVCRLHGGECVLALSDAADSCENALPSRCEAAATDQLCRCTRP